MRVDDFALGIFRLTILVFVLLFVIIIGVPWFWNWIVHIWQSPLPAGAASAEYINDTIIALTPYVLGIILVIMGIQTAIDNRANNDLIEYELREFKHSPTMQTTPNSPARAATEAKQTVNSQSREGDSVTYSTTSTGAVVGTFNDKEYGTLDGHEPGSRKAQDAYKSSIERQERLKRIYELEEKIRQARINEGADKMLAGVKNRFIAQSMSNDSTQEV
jgi:hypothetical protein